MRAPIRSCARLTLPALLAIPVPFLFVAGCGGTTTKTVTQTSTVTVRPTTKARSHVKLKLKQFVTKAGAKPKFARTASVKPGDDVVFLTQVINQTKAKGTKLEVTIEKGPASTLVVRAGNAGKNSTASASLKSADGQSITLQSVKYKCVIAPTTICPADKAVETSRGFDIVLSPPTKKGVPVALTATVGKG